MFQRENWPNDISLEKMLQISSDYARLCGMQGEAVYCFVLGEAIVHLQKTGCDDLAACKLAFSTVNRYRSEHPEEFHIEK